MKDTRGISFLFLASIAFLGLGIELIYALVIEVPLYKIPINEWTLQQTILHWTITCITWALFAYVLVRTSKFKYGFDVFEHDGSMKIWQWICVLFCIAFVLTFSYISWGGFKCIKEFENKGLVKFIFQYIYYAFETVLFTLIIVFGQKAFEKWFKKRNFPYGALVVALTWGLAHIFSKGSLSTGLYTTIAGFIFGLVYLLVNRDIKKTFIILYIIFAF